MEARAIGVSRSEALFEAATHHLVGGVSASARLNPALGRPLYITRGDGCRLYDADGREFIDYNLSHGATFLGHNHSAIRQAIEQALHMGIICSYETEYHARLAERLCQIIPSAEQVRFANSGSEATMVAIRLARAATGRHKLLKFEGHFHGLHDYVIWNAHGSTDDPAATYPYVPPAVESAGVPPGMADYVIVIPWNDPAALEQAVWEHGEEVAAIICEPVNYNSACIPPKPGFLNILREQATRCGAELIFDEVLSGFRMAPGGAQEYYGVTPDVTVLAKAVANGVPLAVIAGQKDIMSHLAPLGGAAHSGTYSGHLFAILAALASLEVITAPGFYLEVFAKAERLYSGLSRLFETYHMPARVQGLGARFGILFGVSEPAWDYQGAARQDGELAYRFIAACFERGIYFHNYGRMALGHHGFSASHTPADIDETLNRVEAALQDMRPG
jgi:glutamate-1-semialdehyde 2,1-aminomutase